LKVLEVIQRKGYRDSEWSRWQDISGAAKAPWFAQPRAEELRGGLMAAAAPHRERRGLREQHGAASGEGLVGD